MISSIILLDKFQPDLCDFNGIVSGIEQVPYGPCRLYPHVVVEVGLVSVNDPWGYAEEPLMLMPDRSKDRR